MRTAAANTPDASNVCIVPITTAHAAGFWACVDAVARERKFLAMLEAPALQSVQGFVSENVKNDMAHFVAVDTISSQPQVIGWADVLPLDRPTMAHSGVLGMGLLSAYRGQGLGRKLLTACIDKSWANGLTRIGLSVRHDNANAIALYERMGFLREGIKHQALQFDGRFYDEVVMGMIRS
jgi:ribosomal protein S18 acetylase RimI-like enzyme